MSDDAELRALMLETMTKTAQLKAGMTVAVIDETTWRKTDLQKADAVILFELLDEIGCRTTRLEMRKVLPFLETDGPFTGVNDARMAPEVFAILKEVDAVITNRAGLAKYNVDGSTLANYYGVQFTNLWNMVPHHCVEALRFPLELSAVLEQRAQEILVAACEEGRTFRLTNPWGTDLSWTARPGDVNAGGDTDLEESGRRDLIGLSEGNDRMYRSLVGFSAYETCDGSYVAVHSAALGGHLDSPVVVTIKDGRAVDFEGDQRYTDKLRSIVDPRGHRIHALLMGLNPRYSVFDSDGAYFHNHNGAGVGSLELTLGGAGVHYACGEWTTLGGSHIQLGFAPKITVHIDDEPFVEDGVPRFLSDPDIVEFAESIGARDQLVPIDWPHREPPEVNVR